MFLLRGENVSLGALLLLDLSPMSEKRRGVIIMLSILEDFFFMISRFLKHFAGYLVENAEYS